MMVRIPDVLRSMRPVQWLKNGFVLAPVVFSGMLDDASVWLDSLIAVAAFCAASSAVYLVNDVIDREADRKHPSKRERPIASGEISVGTALVAAGILVAAAMAAAWRICSKKVMSKSGYRLRERRVSRKYTCWPYTACVTSSITSSWVDNTGWQQMTNLK